MGLSFRVASLELYRFLNSNLKCLSDEGYYMGDNQPTMFRPTNNNWAPLANILHTIHHYDRYGIDKAFRASDIIYLREGFNGNFFRLGKKWTKKETALDLTRF